MAAPLGLKLYNLGNRREGPARVADRPPRPPGRLVWLHAPTANQISPILALARRLVEEEGFAVVLTAPAGLIAGPARQGVILQPPPDDTPADVRAFLDHWRPEVAVFSDGELRPSALHEAGERKVPVLMVNARAPTFLRERDGWYPGLMRAALGRFSEVFAVDEAAARAFRKAGAPLSNVAVTGRTEEDSAVLPCLEAERAALALQLAARPVWFAAGLPEAEEAAVLQAHRAALRQSHRLLLILLPERTERTDALGHELEDRDGWSVARRAEDEEPASGVEVFVVDNPAEYGLWYRLAPISFLGGTLAGPGSTRDPMEAAALGSAILFGPKTAPYSQAFDRLGAARAARQVRSATDLAEALGELLAPDRSARLARAAWTVASDGTEVTDRLITRIHALTGGAA
jgi:3-deoxy-D-manno-octulosonic-acid transferase